MKIKMVGKLLSNNNDDDKKKINVFKSNNTSKRNFASIYHRRAILLNLKSNLSKIFFFKFFVFIDFFWFFE